MTSMTIRERAHHHAMVCLLYARERRMQEAPKAAISPVARKPVGRPSIVGNAIETFLRENGPATGEQVATALGIDKERAQTRCRNMRVAGKLIFVTGGGHGNKNAPAVYGVAE